MSRCTDSVRDAIHRTVSKNRVAELAGRLIRERSDLSGDMEYGAGQLLMRIAAEMGLEAEEQPVEGRRSNILIRMRGAPAARPCSTAGTSTWSRPARRSFGTPRPLSRRSAGTGSTGAAPAT